MTAIWTCPDCGAVLGEADKLPKVVHVCHQRGAANLRREIERLHWNLAGCLTIGEAEKPMKYAADFALPALDAVNVLADKFVALRIENERLRAALEQVYSTSREYAMYDVFRGFDRMTAIARTALFGEER